MANDSIENVNSALFQLKPVSVVIPTYNREKVLLNTINALLALTPAEILIIDQTRQHHSMTNQKLTMLEKSEKIRWIRLCACGCGT